MKWLGHWVQGFKCLKIYFQIAFANHININMFSFSFFLLFLLLLFVLLLWKPKSELLWVCILCASSYHVLCRWCYCTWLIVFAFDFHSIKFLFSTPIYTKHDEHVPALCHIQADVHTNSNSLPQSINILNQRCSNWIVWEMLIEWFSQPKVRSRCVERWTFERKPIHRIRNVSPYLCVYVCEIPCDNIIMTIECVNDFNAHNPNALWYLSRCFLSIYRSQTSRSCGLYVRIHTHSVYTFLGSNK